jgi:Xaa-Pro aminopeptidase
MKKNIPIEHLCYTAGFFDADGTVGIYKSYKKGFKTPYYRMRVALINTNKETLEQIRAFYGIGSFQIVKHEKEIHKWRHHLIISGREALNFIKAIYPYVHLKQDRLDVAIEFQEHMNNFGGRYGQNGVPKEHLEIRENLRLKMKELNKRGYYSK